MQMRTLATHFNPVPLGLFLSHLRNNEPLPPRSCLVTFDDGWLDNYEVAFPILRKYSIPAVIFLPVDYISADVMFWQEEILMRLTNLTLRKDEEALRHINSILGVAPGRQVPTIRDIRDYVIDLKSRSDMEISQMLDIVRDELSSYSEPQHYNRYLTWEQVAEMSDAGITFASHGLSHRILCKLSDTELQEELNGSRATLERQLGESVLTIAYPNGGYDERVMAETELAGYEMGFCTRGGFVKRDCNLFSIPRNNIHNGNGRNKAQFMCTCAKVF
jgi:peptidoglycan/xylan/chitin deacetylase (PgdA/CDA1 family)